MARLAERPRRRRGAVEALGSVILGFESIVVFLAGLTIYGLDALPYGIAPWWGIVAGSVFAVFLIVLSGLLRYRAAVFLGWAAQVILALGGFLVPAILFVALLFGGLWWFAMVKGAALDRKNNKLIADYYAANPDEEPGVSPVSREGSVSDD